ncbi:3-hexulose-6-phosphate synthase [Curtobacterium sp. S6]|uniref:3-hexulose-6-phosphate synthase n=1 Tax=Curtobacterium sp. S6 TaxID=1479623 RepID=UPI0004AAC396|nr:3-hexulose-6-phosphate synthase [Curtobacterium sp. S6]
MQLQFAMDTLTTEDALRLSQATASHVDILELGTPLIKSEGFSAIRAIKDAHPDKIVFADLKTMDAGELEADEAFKAGADLVTVLGVAGNSTIAGAVQAARRHNKGVVVDLIGSEDKPARAREVTDLGASFVEMHAGLDEQAEEGYDFRTLLDAGRRSGVSFSVAGGINAESVQDVEASGASVAVAGSAIYGAEDPGEAARQIRARFA